MTPPSLPPGPYVNLRAVPFHSLTVDESGSPLSDPNNEVSWVAEIPGTYDSWRYIANRGWERGPSKTSSGGLLGKLADITGFTSLSGVKELDPLRDVMPLTLSPEVHTGAALWGAQVLTGINVSALSEPTDMDLRDVLRASLPVLGSTVPDVFGPAGTIGLNLLTQALTPTPAAPAPAPIQMAALPALPALGSMLGGAVVRAGTAAVGVIRSVGGRILGVVLPSGVKISRAKAVALAKTMGVQAAATALGIGAVEMAEIVMQESARKGRAKGVSGAALRTTKRTMRTVEKMHRQIAGYCRDAGVRTTRFVRAPMPSGKRCR